jgi:hypothetical protein
MHTSYTSGWPLGLCLFLGAILPTLCSAQSIICYVDSNPRYTSTQGDSWETPIKSLQAAIDLVAASGGGEVWVKAGVYKPEGDSRESTFLLRQNVKLYGGFRGTESERSQRNAKANRTVLSGDIGKTTDSDNCYHVVTGSSKSLLDGFIISKGNANGLAEQGVGAGLLLPNRTRDFSLINCTFEKNNAGWQGGGVFAENASLTVTNCMFFANAALSGAGLATKGDTNLRMLDTFFSSNFSLQSGGAIELQPGIDAVITGCSFVYNRSEGSGGAVSLQIPENGTARLELIDSTFTGNIAAKNAGAILLRGPFRPNVIRCSFTQNVGKQGAGAIAVESGVVAVIEECLYNKNKGMPDQEDIGTHQESIIAENREAAPEPVIEEPQETPETRPIMLPGVYVHREPDSKILLSDLLSEQAYSVLVLGELTDPDFIQNYGLIETTARAYESANVEFFYIYRYLAHPENNGYLQPFHIMERARQARIANQLLKTRIPWLLDTMENATAKALEQEENRNSIFIYSSDGIQRFAGPITDASTFRKALENLAGAPASEVNTTPPSAPKLKPINLKPAEVVNRIAFNTLRESFLPLEVFPQKSRFSFYAKLRAEANETLLKSGNGKIYLGFHIDPLYDMEWNNRKDPLNYRVRAPMGVLVPSSGRAPYIADPTADSEPREFILDARQLDMSKPLSIKVEYYVKSSNGRQRKKVSQSYLVYLKADPYAGQAYRRQVPYGGFSLPRKKQAAPKIHPALLRYDKNKDGRITRSELPGTLNMKFRDIYTNRDGYLSDEEYETYLRNR